MAVSRCCSTQIIWKWFSTYFPKDLEKDSFRVCYKSQGRVLKQWIRAPRVEGVKSDPKSWEVLIRKFRLADEAARASQTKHTNNQSINHVLTSWHSHIIGSLSSDCVLFFFLRSINMPRKSKEGKGRRNFWNGTNVFSRQGLISSGNLWPMRGENDMHFKTITVASTVPSLSSPSTRIRNRFTGPRLFPKAERIVYSVRKCFWEVKWKEKKEEKKKEKEILAAWQ